MNPEARMPNFGGATLLGRPPGAGPEAADPAAQPRRVGSPELTRLLAEVKGQAQFLLYVADQLEDSLQQLNSETDPGHGAFLCKILGMYSGQLESKHQSLGDRIAEACQELYVAVREYDAEEPAHEA
jgi:hypothetical protein